MEVKAFNKTLEELGLKNFVTFEVVTKGIVVG